MSATKSISTEKLSRLIGTPSCPAIIDVRPVIVGDSYKVFAFDPKQTFVVSAAYALGRI